MFAVWATREIRRYFQVCEEHPMEIPWDGTMGWRTRCAAGHGTQQVSFWGSLGCANSLSSIHASKPTHIKTVLMHGYTCTCVHMSYISVYWYTIQHTDVFSQHATSSHGLFPLHHDSQSSHFCCLDGPYFPFMSYTTLATSENLPLTSLLLFS